MRNLINIKNYIDRVNEIYDNIEVGDRFYDEFAMREIISLHKASIEKIYNYINEVDTEIRKMKEHLGFIE